MSLIFSVMMGIGCGGFIAILGDDHTTRVIAIATAIIITTIWLLVLTLRDRIVEEIRKGRVTP